MKQANCVNAVGELGASSASANLPGDPTGALAQAAPRGRQQSPCRAGNCACLCVASAARMRMRGAGGGQLRRLCITARLRRCLRLLRLPAGWALSVCRGLGRVGGRWAFSKLLLHAWPVMTLPNGLFSENIRSARSRAFPCAGLRAAAAFSFLGCLTATRAAAALHHATHQCIAPGWLVVACPPGRVSDQPFRPLPAGALAACASSLATRRPATLFLCRQPLPVSPRLVSAASVQPQQQCINMSASTACHASPQPPSRRACAMMRTPVGKFSRRSA
jgi:hypothetical protein